MNHPLSPAGRSEALARMGREPLDLLVIGGGITGCGLARDAALRGLATGLVEKVDFGYGTSSRSSKLVHGGMRYLLYGDVRMVCESGRERKVLRRLAPHLVHPLPFLYPTQSWAGLAGMRAAFWVYDRLVGASTEEQSQVLSRDEVRRRAPHLREPLVGGVTYGEYLTDDARLTLENAMSAALNGALVANHAPVVGFVHARGRLAGALVRDDLTGRVCEVRARVVVNATGPWAEETLRLGGDAVPGHILPSKGVHLGFSAARLPLAGALVLRGTSGRQGFAIRRGDLVYVGTTDEVHHGPIDEPTADAGAVASLLTLTQECFAGLGLTESDIVTTWAGLRPLIAAPGKTPRDTSRHDHVWESPDGLITIAGGKLTTYRPMAARVMQHVAAALGRDLRENRRTAEEPLPGADLQGESQRGVQALLAAGGLPPAAAQRLAGLYGTRTRDAALALAEDPGLREPVGPGSPVLRVEVWLAVQQEMACSLLDFMDRRSGLLLFGLDHGCGVAPGAAAFMADLLGWSPAEASAQMAAYQAAVARSAGAYGMQHHECNTPARG